MSQDVVLGARHEKQEELYTCGPACINIVLTLWNKEQPQTQVWAGVQANTGATRPGDARPQVGSFATQHCDLCSKNQIVEPDGTTYGDYRCWFTTPEALAATLNTWSPEFVGATYVSGGEATIRAIVDSIAATPPVPAVFTIKPALHWVVAVGYQIDGVGSSVLWNGNKVTALYVRDPAMADPGTDTLQMTTLDGLRRGLSGLLMAVECGKQRGLYPVVVKSPYQPYVTRMLSWVFLGIAWIDPRRWLRLLRWRRRPGPPTAE